MGDLNWFPEAKAKWLANQDLVAAHILSLNEDQITIVGIDESKNTTDAAAFSVYPNPVKDIITVNSVDEMSSLKIYSITGIIYRNIDMTSKANRNIDISELADGVYLLKVNFVNGGYYTSRFIKE